VLQFLIVRLEKWVWMLLDRERSRLIAELRLLPGAATGAAECSGTAAESIALLDPPVTDIAEPRGLPSPF
jgi:hypothetical protein